MLKIYIIYKFSIFHGLYYQFFCFNLDKFFTNIRIIFCSFIFSWKLINEQDGIRASRVEFFFKFNKRACSFIRYFRVPSTHLMTFIKLNTILNMSFSWKMSEKISNDRRTVTQSFFPFWVAHVGTYVIT